MRGGLLRSSPLGSCRGPRRLSCMARHAFVVQPSVHAITLCHPNRLSTVRTLVIHDVGMDLFRLAMPVGVGENDPRRAAALLLTLGRIGSVSLADDGLEEGLGSWFRLRNRLQSGQSHAWRDRPDPAASAGPK